jgi:cysteine-rich repeat protein
MQTCPVTSTTAVRRLPLLACAALAALVLTAAPPVSALAQQVLYSVSGDDDVLRTIDPASGATLDAVDIINPGINNVFLGHGLATHPLTGELWALIELVGQAERELAIVDPLTGLMTLIGDPGDRFEALAFDAAGTLYAVTGESANTPETLFTLSTVDAAPTFVRALGNGDNGEAIAFDPSDGLLYHGSGLTTKVFESVNPGTLVVTNIPRSGATYRQASALTRLDATTLLLADTDSNVAHDLYRITTGGTVTRIGALDHRANGLAFARRQVLYSVGFDDGLLRTVGRSFNSTWPTVSSVPITVPGKTVYFSAGLAAHPLTHELWALVYDGGPSRELVRVDPATGLATDIGDTGDDFMGLAFDAGGTLYGVTSSVASLRETLFRISTVDATATPLTRLGVPFVNQDGTLAFNPRDGLLYHAAGFEVFQSINPTTLAVTDIPLSGDGYGGATGLTHTAGNVLLLTTFGEDTLAHTTDGVAVMVGFLDHYSTGLAQVPSPMCGDGLVQGTEQCDDGNTLDGDCCSATCRFEGNGAPCGDDGNLCSTDVCDGLGSCGHVFAPQAVCKRPIAPRRASVLLKKLSGGLDLLQWRWQGAVTAMAEFGDPTTTTRYELCVYDTRGGAASLAARATMPAGGTCGARPCWQVRRQGFVFSDVTRAQHASRTLVLSEGLVPGRARIALQLKGPNVPLPPLPLFKDPRVTLQLKSSSGACWEAPYATAITNGAQQFRAVSD